MLAQSVEPLTGFLKLILHGYMIDNVINVIEGIKGNIDLEILLRKSDPLGYFPELKNIRTVDGDDYGALYETVLIDLPIGKYFRIFLEDILAEETNKDASRIPEIMKDFRPEKIKNILKKIWLTELFAFVQESTNSITKEIMSDLLMFESDCQTIQVIYNTIGNREMGSAQGRFGERKKYINSIGYLYPDRDRELSNADDFPKLKEAVSPYQEYREMLDKVSYQGDGEQQAEFSSASKSIGKRRRVNDFR